MALIINGMPTWVDVEKEQDLPLEFFPKGWYLVITVPEHSNGIHNLSCCVELLWELFLNYLSLCHTQAVHGRPGRYRVFVGKWR